MRGRFKDDNIDLWFAFLRSVDMCYLLAFFEWIFYHMSFSPSHPAERRFMIFLLDDGFSRHIHPRPRMCFALCCNLMPSPFAFNICRSVIFYVSIMCGKPNVVVYNNFMAEKQEEVEINLELSLSIHRSVFLFLARLTRRKKKPIKRRDDECSAEVDI